MNLKGKRALVTGGAVRLGRFITLSLAEAGADVIIHYHLSQQQAEELTNQIHSSGKCAVAITADLSQGATVCQELFAELAEKDMLPEILINSAAIFEAGGVVETSEELYDRHLGINLKAPFFLAQEFVKHLPNTQGQIINITDWRGFRPPGTHTAYTIAKAGFIALTKSLALELAPNVRVNAIAPGAILPPSDADEHYFERLTTRVPLKRTGQPEDITNAVLYLLRSEFITGEVIAITGGEHL